MPRSLYHFTSREALGLIRLTGLDKGEVPLGPRKLDCLNGVWLTSDPDPSGHGLTESREVSDEEKIMAAKLDGHDPSRSYRYLDKRAVRITVNIPNGDNRLSRWSKWARNRIDPSWYEALNETGGGKADTWFIYWGTIPPEWFASVSERAGLHDRAHDPLG